ncbi:hypothetical protein [Staphylococcus massiliensis]|uniref:hypothetical protein n=1 Tax=Staphylococcus massiliensis TaxID=555791 RepID=UPI001EE04B35|nr:hypothetical protein [Staphylococcus massiliensis]MCG3398966.1 hypothetical protein [Staphylococcus massiliensis]MCG3401032.1 hypothetical protein [Staphylococcus massiliensis]MCG3413015.1 hypothetical protein [Staphylococcus massiliensis]
MKKSLLLLISGSLLLTACGSQDLAPIEEKTTKLRESNHKTKLKIQELKTDISDKKERLHGLEMDMENGKQAKQNQKHSDYLEASAKYYEDITHIIEEYAKIDEEVTENKGEDEINEQLDELQEKASTAYDDYKSNIEEVSKISKDDDKQIKSINKNLDKALTEIKDGYRDKDDKKITKGRQKLREITYVNQETESNDSETTSQE